MGFRGVSKTWRVLGLRLLVLRATGCHDPGYKIASEGKIWGVRNDTRVLGHIILCLFKDYRIIILPAIQTSILDPQVQAAATRQVGFLCQVQEAADKNLQSGFDGFRTGFGVGFRVRD